MKKRGVKRMPPTKVIDLNSRRKILNLNRKKPVQKMSQESIKSSYDFKRRSWERD